ncbi:hypothetical protein, partial [Enterobacter intestinihominis]
RVLPGVPGACRAEENPIVGRVIVKATRQKRSTGVSDPRPKARNRQHNGLFHPPIRLFSFLLPQTGNVQQVSLIQN